MATETKDHSHEETEEFPNIFWVRPLIDLEKSLTIQEEIKQIKLRTEGHGLTRDITDFFRREIIESFQHHTNLIIYITGLPGTGKTQAALGIASLIQRWIIHLAQIHPKIHFTFGFKQTNEIANDLNEYDIISQDEQEKLSGTDSTSLMHAILNLQEIVLRKNKNTYIISSADDASRLKNACHVIFEAYGENWKTRTNKLIAYSPKTNKPLGYVLIPLLKEEDTIMLEHGKRELEYKKRIRLQKGYVSAGIDKKRLDVDTTTLINSIFGHTIVKYIDLLDSDKELLRGYRKELLKTDLVLAEIPGSEHYQNRVLNEVWRKLLKYQIQIKLEDRKQAKLEAEAKKLAEQQVKDQEKEQYQILLEQEIQSSLPQVVNHAFEKYKDQKNVRTVQLRTFFKLNGVMKENVDIAIGLTLDYLSQYDGSHEGGSFKQEKSIVDANVEFVFLKKIEDTNFIHQIYDCMKTVTRSRITTKKLKDEYIEAFLLRYADGATLDILREEFSVKSKSSFSNNYDNGGWFAVIEKELLGHAAEDALLRTYYKNYSLVAGNTEPDLWSDEDNKMIEVKARTRRERPSSKMLNKAEIHHLQTGGNVELCMISIEPQKVALEFYSVQLVDQEK